MKLLTKNQLKILAMVCMTIDHIGAALFPQAVWLRVIGRLAFPLFSYCIAEGCRYTRNKARYFGSVFACGAVCVIAFLPFGGFCGNALITLSLSILLLYGVEAWKSSGKLRFLALTAALAAVFYLLCRTVYIDYGFAGVLLPVYAAAGRILWERVFADIPPVIGERLGFAIGLLALAGVMCSASACWRSFRFCCSAMSAANGRCSTFSIFTIPPIWRSSARCGWRLKPRQDNRSNSGSTAEIVV